MDPLLNRLTYNPHPQKNLHYSSACAKSHWMHLFGFSPLCVCSLNALGSKQARSHCICLVFLHYCALSSVSSSHLPERMHNHTDCICVTFLCCAFLNVSSICLPEKRHNHTGCICLVFLHCEFSNVSSKHLHKRMQSHIGCICLVFLHCVFLYVSSDRLLRGCS